jgi:hypothetical protein
MSLLVNILQFPFSLSDTGPKIFQCTFLSKMFNCFLSLFVSVQVSDACVNVLSIIVLTIRLLVGARGGIVVKALHYKLTGRRFDS